MPQVGASHLEAEVRVGANHDAKKVAVLVAIRHRGVVHREGVRARLTREAVRAGRVLLI